MAKKKEFDNIVDESFEEGYKSEPEIITNQEKKQETKEQQSQEPEALSENERLLQKINAGDQETLTNIWEREDRSTYYLTDHHRACIDIMAYEEGMKKNEIVVSALNQYFSEKVKESAKERVISIAIKKLEREIKEEETK